MKKRNQFEIDKSKIDFDCLWIIKDIDVNIVTFAKYEIHAGFSFSNSDDKSNITIKELIGIEKHKVTPDIQLELSGKVGEILKAFESKKHNNIVKVNKIKWLEI